MQTTDTLTINTGRLADIFLPDARAGLAAIETMDRECMKALRKAKNSEKPADMRHYDHLNEARCALWTQTANTIDVIVNRGGLLLIGGAA